MTVPSKLKQHFTAKHLSLVCKDITYFLFDETKQKIGYIYDLISTNYGTSAGN
jgi:hypothetical protein